MTVGIGKWGIALGASLAIHASAAGWFYSTSEDAKFEGGSPTQISVLGDAFTNEAAAGELNDQIEPEETELIQPPDETVEEMVEDVAKAEDAKPDETQVSEAKNASETIPDQVKFAKIAQASTTSRSVARPVVQQQIARSISVENIQPSEALTAAIEYAEITIASLQPELVSDPSPSEAVPLTVPDKTEASKPAEEVQPEHSSVEPESSTIEKVEPQEAKQLEPQEIEKVEPEQNTPILTPELRTNLTERMTPAVESTKRTTASFLGGRPLGRLKRRLTLLRTLPL